MGYQLRCKRLHENAKLPKRALSSAGYDVWPLFPGTIFPGNALEIPLGFAAEITPGHAAVFIDKAGPGFKGLIHLAGLVDADFRGEWKLKLFNSSNITYGFTSNKAVCQFLIIELPVETHLPEWVDVLSETERGAGGWGSSGH